MKFFVSAVCVCWSVAAWADLTIESVTESQGGMGASGGDGLTVSYIKGERMRVDTDDGKESTILNLPERQMISLNHRRKRAEVMNMGDLAEAQRSIGATVDVSVEANGQSKTVMGYETEGYDIHMNIDAAPAGMENMPFEMTMVMTGTTWVAPEVEGSEEVAAFYREMAEAGLFFGPPEAAEAQPDQTRGMTEMWSKIAAAGMPLESTMRMEMQGSGPMAMMGKAMNFTTTNTVQRVSNDNLDDALFEIPEGYKVKNAN